MPRKPTRPLHPLRMAEAPTPAPAPEETISAVKGFNRDWMCRDFQFEIGKTYEHNGDVVACQLGFHACEYPLDCFSYYAPSVSRYAEVAQSGKLDRHSGDSKVASARITIEAEIDIPKIVQRAITWVLKQTKPADSKHSEGDQSASSATGFQSASSATGDLSASSATGFRSASSATGNQSASSATGFQSASSATGDRSASSVHGEKSCAMACGHEGKVLADKDGCALFLTRRDPDSGDILHAWAGISGRDGIKAGAWYSLDADGKPVAIP